MTLLEKWEIQDYEDDIMDYLNRGKKVFIESGCLNDTILSFSISNILNEREVIFTTTACVFPEHINFMGQPLSSVYTEDFKGNLFVHVS